MISHGSHNSHWSAAGKLRVPVFGISMLEGMNMGELHQLLPAPRGATGVADPTLLLPRLPAGLPGQPIAAQQQGRERELVST